VNAHQKQQNLFDTQGGLCWLCHQPMRRPEINLDPPVATREPVGTHTSGRSDELSNLRLAHRVCSLGHTLSRRRQNAALVILVVADERVGPLPFTFAWLRTHGHFDAANDKEDLHNESLPPE
jgi:hypothetical protein